LNRDIIALMKEELINGKVGHWTIKSIIEMHFPSISLMENSPIELENQP
jgi:hypothetical protein